MSQKHIKRTNIANLQIPNELAYFKEFFTTNSAYLKAFSFKKIGNEWVWRGMGDFLLSQFEKLPRWKLLPYSIDSVNFT